jgi:hypothetical protein
MAIRRMGQALCTYYIKLEVHAKKERERERRFVHNSTLGSEMPSKKGKRLLAR